MIMTGRNVVVLAFSAFFLGALFGEAWLGWYTGFTILLAYAFEPS